MEKKVKRKLEKIKKNIWQKAGRAAGRAHKMFAFDVLVFYFILLLSRRTLPVLRRKNAPQSIATIRGGGISWGVVFRSLTHMEVSYKPGVRQHITRIFYHLFIPYSLICTYTNIKVKDDWLTDVSTQNSFWMDQDFYLIFRWPTDLTRDF